MRTHTSGIPHARSHMHTQVHSLSRQAGAAMGIALKSIAHLAETFVFMYMGLDLIAQRGAVDDLFDEDHGIAGVDEGSSTRAFVGFAVFIVPLARLAVVSGHRHTHHLSPLTSHLSPSPSPSPSPLTSHLSPSLSPSPSPLTSHLSPSPSPSLSPSPLTSHPSPSPSLPFPFPHLSPLTHHPHHDPNPSHAISITPTLILIHTLHTSYPASITHILILTLHTPYQSPSPSS